MSTDLLDAGMPNPKSKPKEDLNNVNGTLAMGIISIVVSIIIMGGIISFGSLTLGILAISRGKRAMSLYKDYPNDYTESSYKKAKAGFICGIVGTSLWGLSKMILILFLTL